MRYQPTPPPIGADQQDGRAATSADEPDREVAQPELLAAPARRRRSGPACSSARRRPRARRARRARTGRATGRCGRRASTTGPVAVRRRPGRPPGGSCRPRCPVAGGPKARSSASGGGGGSGPRRRGRPVAGEAAVDGGRAAERGLLARATGCGAVTGRGASRSGTSPNGPSRPRRAGEGRRTVGGGVPSGPSPPGGRRRCSGGPALAASAVRRADRERCARPAARPRCAARAPRAGDRRPRLPAGTAAPGRLAPAR